MTGTALDHSMLGNETNVDQPVASDVPDSAPVPHDDGNNIDGEYEEHDDDERAFHSPPTDADERRVLFQAIDSFHQYRPQAHRTVHRRRQNFYALPSSQSAVLRAPPIKYLDTLSAVDDAIDVNGDLADAIVALATSSMGLPEAGSGKCRDDDDDDDDRLNWRGTSKGNDHSKAHSTLRQFYRDWTAEGFRLEIKPLLDLILADLSSHLNTSTTQHQQDGHDHDESETAPLPEVLLPGAGLSRLLLELVLAGYNATGNEISYHQLLASNFVLNHTPAANSIQIFPFATTFTNVTSRAHQLRSYTIPDIHPATAIAQAQSQGPTRSVGTMSMAAGDFCVSFHNNSKNNNNNNNNQQYQHNNKNDNGDDDEPAYDAVITAYFIDTAPNLFRYLTTIHSCLKPDGLWINIGPLLWHFDARENEKKEHGKDNKGKVLEHGTEEEDDDDDDNDTGINEPGSFELSYDEVLVLVEKCGFELLQREILPAAFPCTQGNDGGADPGTANPAPGAYIQDPQSMLQHRYQCAHWVARKR